MSEREAIKALVELEHQVVQDATYWIYQLGPLAEDDCGKYTVLEEVPDKVGKINPKEHIFINLDEAIDKYLELVTAWRGGSTPSWTT